MMKLDKVCSLVNSCVPRSAENKKKPFTFVVWVLMSACLGDKSPGFSGAQGVSRMWTSAFKLGQFWLNWDELTLISLVNPGLSPSSVA